MYKVMLCAAAILLLLLVLLGSFRSCSDPEPDPQPGPPAPAPWPPNPGPQPVPPRPTPPAPEPTPTPAVEEFSGRVVKVDSVNTLWVREGLPKLRRTKVTLMGLQEPSAAASREAGRQFVDALLTTAGDRVTCKKGWVLLENGRTLNECVVEAGWAIAEDDQLKAAQTKAQAKKVGIWK